MVVVRIEVWPGGDASQARPAGEIRITNDGTGDHEFGNYSVECAHCGPYLGRLGDYRTGKLQRFSRRLSPYHLVARALAACGIR